MYQYNFMRINRNMHFCKNKKGVHREHLFEYIRIAEFLGSHIHLFDDFFPHFHCSQIIGNE